MVAALRSVALRPRRGIAVLSCLLAGCAMSTGIQPTGPDSYIVSEMRAPALGGAAAAQQVAIAEATQFCVARGETFAPLLMQPGGYPYSAYGPTQFMVSFRCLRNAS